MKCNTLIQVPRWAALLTVDIALPKIEPQIQTELKRYEGQPISMVWRRISKAARTALESWYASL